MDEQQLNDASEVGFDASRPADAARLPVKFVPCLSRTRYSDQLSRADPGFVTQLMAIEQHFPQTRVLRRAGPEEATSAYRLVACGAPVVGRTRRSS